MYYNNKLLIITLVLVLVVFNSAHVIQKQNDDNKNVSNIKQLNIAFVIFPSSTNDTPLTINSIKGVMKFPPFLEYFVQRIQKFFSTYMYEDFSRPPPYDSPNFDGNSLLLNPQNEKVINLTLGAIGLPQNEKVFNLTVEAIGLPQNEVVNEDKITNV